jgi:pilus retraction protein PilT
MSDPANLYALEDLKLISGYQVVPAVASESQIRQVQNKLFALGEGVSEILEEAAGQTAAEPEDELEIGADSEDAPVIRLVSSILQQAVGEGASDIHVEPRPDRVVVRFRVDGVLREVMSIPSKLQSGVIARIKVLARLDIAERRVPQDGRFSVRIGGQKVDLRAASLPTAYGEKVALRLLDTSNVEADLSRLGFAPDVLRRYEEVYHRPYGTILVTGPTGSGKSTTLAAMIDRINETRREHIMSVEDPIEFLHTHKECIVNQREVNQDTKSFTEALKHVLRQDPDVILIGEMRDLETISMALTAAETGHLVFATLHTQDAPQTIDRIIDVFPSHQQGQVRTQLANTIQGIVTQTLVPKRGGGRVVACEILVPTPGVRNLIREGKTHQVYSAMQTGGKFGMQTMDSALAELVRRGVISREEAEKRCSNLEEFRRLSGAGAGFASVGRR